MAIVGGGQNLATELDGHVFVRPSWACAACDQPWPCEPAQQRLREGRTLANLVILMALYRADAIQDTGLPVAEICDRFTGWIC